MKKRKLHTHHTYSINHLKLLVYILIYKKKPLTKKIILKNVFKKYKKKGKFKKKKFIYNKDNIKLIG